MLEGKKLGPILVEKQIGAGAMGTVYRGVMETTGQKLAIKMMSPALASNESSAARFEREAAILKQLRHPHIVRLFGIGKYKGLRYYAMEYIKGESLDQLLARQGKLSWDEVLSLGIQLSQALQHAHDKGVVHRDLKPSNLMILADGTLKLTDFGIAKDLDVTQLTEANCTVGTAAYMSPEQCRGDRSLTYKSDLYSLGVVFFELVTGKKPFHAETAMEMFLCHVEKKPDRASQYALDLPIWMDTLIYQLMEKDPDRRPLNAAMVTSALEEVREKVESQKSAGVEAVGKRVIDKTPLDPKLDEKDREAARALRGKKKKRKKKAKPFYTTIWFQAIGILALLSAMGTVLYFAFRPTPAEDLYAKTKELMASKNPDDWYAARSGPIEEYLAHYRSRKGDETKQMLAWSNWIDIYEADQKIDNYVRKRRDRKITIPHQNDAEEKAFEAGWAESKSDFDEATKLWKEIEEKFGVGSGHAQWGRLAEHRLSMYQQIPKQNNQWTKMLAGVRATGLEPTKLDEYQRLAFHAYRAQRFGDTEWAKELYTKLQEKVADKFETEPNLRYWSLLAMWHLDDLEDVDGIGNREEWLNGLLAKQEGNFNVEMCRTIVALYDGESKLKPQVDRAKALLRKFGYSLS